MYYVLYINYDLSCINNKNFFYEFYFFIVFNNHIINFKIFLLANLYYLLINFLLT